MRQAIETHYVGPTDHRGARVIASCQAKRKAVYWDHALNSSQNHCAAAQALAADLGWKGVWRGGGNAQATGCVFVCIDDPEDGFEIR